MSVCVAGATAFSLPARHRPSVRVHELKGLSIIRMEFAELDDNECYLFDTDDGRKFVCTSNPEELAWHMGLDVKDLVAGVKPDDQELIECAEDWSFNGTPQWACRAGKEEVEVDDGDCEMIGESADEVWFVCSEGKEGIEGVDCSEDTEFGVGGGPGILPQDGEVLCKQKKPQDPGFIGVAGA